jgi:uncharacterized protein YjcR
MIPAQEQAARQLARGMTLGAIAAKLGISRSQMEAWFQEPEFVALCARRKEFEERLVEYRLRASRRRRSPGRSRSRAPAGAARGLGACRPCAYRPKVNARIGRT